MRAFEYRHIVLFDETNLVGNVYYARHIGWQGHCRELFLRQHTPELLPELSGRLHLVTVRCSCDYLAELAAFDEVIVRMRIAGLVQNRINMVFEYWRCLPDGEELVARGEQQVACLGRENERLVPIPIPAPLRLALQLYT